MSAFISTYEIIKPMEGLAMKTFATFCVLSVLLLTACSTTYQAGVYDDVYYSSKDKPVPNNMPAAQPAQQNTQAYDNTPATNPTYQESQVSSQNYSQSNNQASNYDNGNGQYDNQGSSANQQYTDPNGANNVTNNYYGYDSDDYYDYGYSARLRRFHSHNYFDNYYHDYYTNAYWYDNDPFYWGSSIYLGYNWMNPMYSGITGCH